MLKTGSFKKCERIKKSEIFKDLFKSGKKVSVRGAKLFFKHNSLEKNRVGF